MTLKNPFPASYPVIPAYQKPLGRYTSLGDGITFMAENRNRQYSDRFNFSLQRQLPTGMILDVTYFLNFSSFAFDLTRDLNMVDPNISYNTRVPPTFRSPIRSTTSCPSRSSPARCAIRRRSASRR